MNVPSRVLSVAPRYTPGADGATAGHYTIYQDDLRAAASRLGLPFTILADRRLHGSPDVLPALDTTDEQTLTRSLEAVIATGDLVLIYEGSLTVLSAVSELAERIRDVHFVVNLFQPEPNLVPGEKRRRRTSPARVPERIGPNVVVTAETEPRATLAVHLGIPCAGSWRLHTTLWDSPSTAAGSSSRRRDSGPLRVLVPLAERGYDRRTARDIAYVLARLDGCRSGAPVRLTLTGADSTRFSAQVRGPRLEALGGRREVGPAAREAYARLFATHDVVWIPNRTLYRTQSSGKTLDALAVGRPVIAPEGTWPATETARWVGEELSYGAPESIVTLLLDLRTRIGEIHRRLDDLLPTVRRAYAPESTILHVLELAGLVPPAPGPGLPALPPPAPSVATGGSAHEAPERGFGTRRARFDARLLAERVAVIGPLRHLRRRVLRQIGRLRRSLATLR